MDKLKSRSGQIITFFNDQLRFVVCVSKFLRNFSRGSVLMMLGLSAKRSPADTLLAPVCFMKFVLSSFFSHPLDLEAAINAPIYL